MDNRSREARSRNMSCIHSKNTKPEETVRKYLFGKGFRYRKNVTSLPGKPDIVLPKYKTVIFVNGCFWHAHKGCKWFVPPKSNVEFWNKKFEYNINLDHQKEEALTKLGWNVIVIWECQLKPNVRSETLQCLYEALGKTNKIENA